MYIVILENLFLIYIVKKLNFASPYKPQLRFIITNTVGWSWSTKDNAPSRYKILGFPYQIQNLIFHSKFSMKNPRSFNIFISKIDEGKIVQLLSYVIIMLTNYCFVQHNSKFISLCNQNLKLYWTPESSMFNDVLYNAESRFSTCLIHVV